LNSKKSNVSFFFWGWTQISFSLANSPPCSLQRDMSTCLALLWSPKLFYYRVFLLIHVYMLCVRALCCYADIF
jgi:hypothetical protein